MTTLDWNATYPVSASNNYAKIDTGSHRVMRRGDWGYAASGLTAARDQYQELAPTVSIFLLSFDELPTARYHTTFRLLETCEHRTLTEDLALHFVELSKLPRAPAETDGPALWKWGRFLKVRDRRELEDLAMTDPVFEEAKSALERLSADPVAQELAREREIWAWNHEMGLRMAREEGEARGEAKGRAEGEARGEAKAVLAVLEARGVTLTPGQRERILACTDLTELDAWVRRAVTVAAAADLFG